MAAAAEAAALVLVMLQAACAGAPAGMRAKPVPAAAAVLMTASRADAGAPGVPAAPRGWTTQFSDGFTGRAGAAPNPAIWHYVTGTRETMTWTSSTRNGHLDGAGHLDLTAWRYGGFWTSAKLKTTSPNVGAPPGGYLEVTAGIQQPNPARGLGYWPAFWMIGPGPWPETGEIDIMEDIDARSELSGTVHYCNRSYPGGPCGTQGTGSGLRPCPGCQTGYHTYTMVLDRVHPTGQSITFYLDAKPYYTVHESQIGTSVWRAAFDHRMSIILDLAMGGANPDRICHCSTPTLSTTPGGTMRVNYVAVYTTTVS